MSQVKYLLYHLTYHNSLNYAPSGMSRFKRLLRKTQATGQPGWGRGRPRGGGAGPAAPRPGLHRAFLYALLASPSFLCQRSNFGWQERTARNLATKLQMAGLPTQQLVPSPPDLKMSLGPMTTVALIKRFIQHSKPA